MRQSRVTDEAFAIIKVYNPKCDKGKVKGYSSTARRSLCLGCGLGPKRLCHYQWHSLPFCRFATLIREGFLFAASLSSGGRAFYLPLCCFRRGDFLITTSIPPWKAFVMIRQCQDLRFDGRSYAKKHKKNTEKQEKHEKILKNTIKMRKMTKKSKKRIDNGG